MRFTVIRFGALLVALASFHEAVEVPWYPSTDLVDEDECVADTTLKVAAEAPAGAASAPATTAAMGRRRCGMLT
jgi:hypothetical protein